MQKSQVFVAFFAILASAAGLVELRRSAVGVTSEESFVGQIPVTIFRSKGGADSAPVAIIAHGFAGSQQLMQPMAFTLARNGYLAVTFDFAGHGRNEAPMPGGVKDFEKSTHALVDEIGAVARFAQERPEAGHGLAIVGHSMASDLVIRYAMENKGVDAVAALSVFGREVTPQNPKNLLVVDGAWESSRLIDAGRRIVAAAAGGEALERVTYGDMEKGTARRFVLARGAEHIGVLYSRDALTETRDWMNSVFGRSGAGDVDSRGKWLALLFAALVALAWPLTRLLPVVAPQSLGAGLRWRQLWKVALAPALLTPLLLWKLPTDFLPLLLGDYLFVHFAVYGALIVAGLWATGGASETGAMLRDFGRAVAPAVAVAAYFLVAMGLPLDAYVTSFAPTGLRWGLIPLMFASAALYLVAEEWMLRGERTARGGYAFSKFCFILSLAIAVALNPRRLFFLVIIAIVIVLLFAIFGLVDRWVYTRTKDPRVGALGAAFVIGYAIAVTFPIVGP
jgi:dienelactone hydrolase